MSKAIKNRAGSILISLFLLIAGLWLLANAVRYILVLCTIMTIEEFRVSFFQDYWKLDGGKSLNMVGMAASGILCLVFHNRPGKGKQIITGGIIGVLAYVIPSILKYIIDGEWYMFPKYLPIPILIIACGTIWKKEWHRGVSSDSTAEQHNVKRLSLIRETQLCIEEYRALAAMRKEQVLALRALLQSSEQSFDEMIAYLNNSSDKKAYDMLLEELDLHISWKDASAVNLLRICTQMAETLNAGKNIYSSRYRKKNNAQMLKMLERINHMESASPDRNSDKWKNMEEAVRRYCTR